MTFAQEHGSSFEEEESPTPLRAVEDLIVEDELQIIDEPVVVDEPTLDEQNLDEQNLDESTFEEQAFDKRAFDEELTRSLDAACGQLKRLQQPQGWWKGELETNVAIDAEYLMFLHAIDELDAQTAKDVASWIRSQQRADGTWTTFYGGPPELSTTVEAYVALRLAGDSPEDEHMRSTANWVRENGGIESTRVFTRLWLSLIGCWKWDGLPVMPPELIFLPSWGPLSIWSFACWARQTIVALTVVSNYKPVYPVSFTIDELLSGASTRKTKHDPISVFFRLTDRLLRYYETSMKRSRLTRFVRAAALSAAERWILVRQESDGCWGGIQPAMLFSTMALLLRGYPKDHPVIQAALGAISAFTVRDERGRRLEACQSPVWDTALAVVALVDAGVDPADEAVTKARDWLVAQEITIKGDWSVRRPNLMPGGWAFEFANANYPDTDDTAEVLLALSRAGVRSGAVDETNAAGTYARSLAWMTGMRSRDGGWGAFDADNTSPIPSRLPFCDFGEVTDPPSADVTAHVLEVLADEPNADPTIVSAAIDWLWRHQEQDGSWWGRWGVNHIYGTGAVVPALVTAGIDPHDERIQRAVRWLIEHQNPDGGWGEDLRSYVDVAWRARGESTASQTSWALMALLSAGMRDSQCVKAGISWLMKAQRGDGTWDEPYFTGTGFPWDFSLNYHLYRLVWPVTALGRYLHGNGPLPSSRDAV